MSILETLNNEDGLRQNRNEVLAMCAASTKICCKVFYPERFVLPFSPSHDKVFDLLDNDEIQRLALAAWRGFGKSSIVQLGYPTKRILFCDSHFIVPISCTSSQAVSQSENLKRELMSNTMIHKLGFKTLQSDTWARDLWIVNTLDKYGCQIMPRSYGQQVRGFLYKNKRPDLLIFDDLEDSETVYSEDQRAKKLEFVYADALGAIDKGSKKWRAIYIGTLLHNDALLARLLRDEDWHSERLELCDDEGVSNWPEQMDNNAIASLKQMYQNQGLIDSFFREYRNLPASKEHAPFKADCFKYYTPGMLNTRFIEYVVLVDPAKSTNDNSCDTAIVCCGIDMFNGDIFVVDMFAGRVHPHEQIYTAIGMCQKWKARVLGVENAGSGLYIQWPWENAIKVAGLQIEVVMLKAVQGPSQYIPERSKAGRHGKDSRIGSALVPLYNMGHIWHNREHPMTAKLERQLIDFPAGERVDIIDALAYVVGLMDEGERYFMNREVSKNGNGMPDGNLDVKRETAALKALIENDEYEPEDWRV